MAHMEGNQLFDAVQTGYELDRKLRTLSARELSGPAHHGAVMFREDVYEKVGGYRPQFLVAQDLDLWTRLSDYGICLGIPEILYEAIWEPGSISHLKRKQQIIATKAMLTSRQLRANSK